MSFFNEFKYSLKEDKGDLGGRYFAKVLLEVIVKQMCLERRKNKQ